MVDIGYDEQESRGELKFGLKYIYYVIICHGCTIKAQTKGYHTKVRN